MKPATGVRPPDLAEVVGWYRSRSRSPVEVVQDCLNAIERGQPRLNAFRCVDADAAVAQAQAAHRRWERSRPCGRLDGVPISVKDTFAVAGEATWSGSMTTDRAPATCDSPLVARLRTEGAIIVGKTTTSEFGWKPVTDSPATGITRNPYDDTLTPGGSSGGSAVAVAAGMCALAVGSDGGGSIRIPAAFTGTVGLKPSHGLIPVWPASVLPALAHVGPIANYTGDAALVLDIAVGPDPLDWTGPPPSGRYSQIVDEGVTGLRVGVSTTAPHCTVAPAIAEAITGAARILEEHGAHISMVDLPFGDVADAFDTVWFAGMSHVVNGLPEARQHLVDEDLRRRAASYRALPADALLRASDTIMRVRQDLGRFHETYDLLLTPTVPVPPFPAGRLAPPGMTDDSWTDWTPFTYPCNLTQQPALTVPCGQTETGLPVGAHLLAAKHRDDLVLRAGRVLEDSTTHATAEGQESP